MSANGSRYPRDQFNVETYKVNRWEPGKYGSLIETLAKCSHFDIAEAAYRAALPIYPKDYITFQIGARVVHHRHPGEESRSAEETPASAVDELVPRKV